MYVCLTHVPWKSFLAELPIALHCDSFLCCFFSSLTHLLAFLLPFSLLNMSLHIFWLSHLILLPSYSRITGIESNSCFHSTIPNPVSATTKCSLVSDRLLNPFAIALVYHLSLAFLHSVHK